MGGAGAQAPWPSHTPACYHHRTYGGKWFWATWHLSALQAPWAEAFLGYGWGVEGFGVLHGADRPPWGGGLGGSRGTSGTQSPGLFALLLGGGFQSRMGPPLGFRGGGGQEVTPFTAWVDTPWARLPRFTATRVLASKMDSWESKTGQTGTRHQQRPHPG